MKFVHLFIVKFFLLHNCHCQDYTETNENCIQGLEVTYGDNVIYLIEPPNSSNNYKVTKEFNNILQEQLPCINFIVMQNYCFDDVKGTIQLTENVRNVINMGVANINEYNYDRDIKAKDVYYAGLTGKFAYLCDEYLVSNSESCVNIYEYYVKLISASIMLQEDLYRYILLLTKEEYVNADQLSLIRDDICPNVVTTMTVLLCKEQKSSFDVENSDFDRNFDDYYHTIDLKSVILETAINNCSAKMEELRTTLTAVAASKPFQANFESRIPIIFYNQPYLMQEHKTSFPNSLLIMRNSKLLPYAVTQFMRRMQWTRIAILSDDSPYSEEFEDKLTKLFVKENVAHVAVKCMALVCDFRESLAYLNTVKAKIIIVNIEPRNGRKFYEAMRYKRDNKLLVWIVRDWPFEDLASYEYPFRKLGIVYTISFNKYESFEPDRLALITNSNLQRNRIQQALELIENVIRTNNEDKDIKLDHNGMYSKLNQEANLLNVFDVAYVGLIISEDTGSPTKYKPRNHIEEMLQITITDDEDGVTTSMDRQGGFPKLLDRLQCVVNKNNYFDPCGNQEILYIMLVIIAFSLILLVITVFFNNISSHSYSHL